MNDGDIKKFGSVGWGIIKILKDDELRKKMGENAYKKMKKEILWDKIAGKTVSVYKEVIDEHKSKRRSKWLKNTTHTSNTPGG